MSERVFLRSLGEICVCFALVGAFPKFFVRDMFLLTPALLCALGTALGPWLEKRNLKYLALLLPLSTLWLADTVMEYLILTPAILYAGVLICRGAYHMDYYTCREQFLRVCVWLGVLAGLVFPLGYFEGMFGASWDLYDISAVLFYGLIYVFTQVFLLRQLRMGVDSRPEDRLRDRLEMLVVLGLTMVVTLGIIALEELFRKNISDIVTFIMMVVGFLPMVVLRIINMFLADDGGAYIEAVGQYTDPTFPGEQEIPDLEGVVEMPVGQDGFPWFLAIFVLGAVCVGVVYLLRTLQATPGGRGSNGTVEDAAPELRCREERWTSNRSKVRRIYRSYLKFVRRKGLLLRIDHTSLDVLREAKGPENPAATLRRIYVRARYDLGRPVLDVDVEDAKAALKEIQTGGV